MPVLLKVDGVHMSYGLHHVLKGISLEVTEGETLTIIGPNGAGKTTLFKAMTGEVTCSRGTIALAGADVTRRYAYERVRLGMGRTFQVARVFTDFTVAENVMAAVEARCRGRHEGHVPWWRTVPSPHLRAQVTALLEQVELIDKASTEARFLSHGDKKRLELTLALAGQPRILMMDEPTAGMSPADRVRTIELVRRLRGETGITVVMTEHDMDVVFGLADRILVMNLGETIACGTPEEIRANPTVQEIYLGKEMAGADG